MTAFDPDLQRFRDAPRNPNNTQQGAFEKAVASLAFLLGFNAVAPNETDAPDLLCVMPGGRMLLIESTVSVRDIHNKIGKLVDHLCAARPGHFRNRCTFGDQYEPCRSDRWLS